MLHNSNSNYDCPIKKKHTHLVYDMFSTTRNPNGHHNIVLWHHPVCKAYCHFRHNQINTKNAPLAILFFSHFFAFNFHDAYIQQRRTVIMRKVYDLRTSIETTEENMKMIRRCIICIFLHLLVIFSYVL